MTDVLGGVRTSKAAVRLFAIGSIDELNACLGVVLAEAPLPPLLSEWLQNIQRTLFTVGAVLAAPGGQGVPALVGRKVEELEQWGVEMERELSKLTQFILPGGTRSAALLHQARTVCRRAERWCVALSQEKPVPPLVLTYLNRLGDALFLAARLVNHEQEIEELLV